MKVEGCDHRLKLGSWQANSSDKEGEPLGLSSIADEVKSPQFSEGGGHDPPYIPPDVEG